MRQLFKIILIVIVTLISSPFIAIIGYQILVIAPMADDFAEMIESADPQDRDPPKVIRDLLVVSHQKPSSPSMYATRLLMNRFSGYQERNTFIRIFESIAWLIWTDIYFDENEIMSILCALSYTGQGIGVNALSVTRFGKPLNELSVDEAAEVVAILRGPSYVMKSQERMARLKAMFLARLENRRI